MPERLEKTSKEIESYKELHARTLRLFSGRHWHRLDNNQNNPRVLNQDVKDWLEASNLPCQVRLGKKKKSKIIFEHRDHAMLFKLAW